MSTRSQQLCFTEVDPEEHDKTKANDCQPYPWQQPALRGIIRAARNRRSHDATASLRLLCKRFNLRLLCKRFNLLRISGPRSKQCRCSSWEGSWPNLAKGVPLQDAHGCKHEHESLITQGVIRSVTPFMEPLFCIQAWYTMRAQPIDHTATPVGAGIEETPDMSDNRLWRVTAPEI